MGEVFFLNIMYDTCFLFIGAEYDIQMLVPFEQIRY